MFHLPIIKAFPAVFFDTTKECFELLKTNDCVSTASDLGSLTVWRYDASHENRKPIYRAERSSWCVVREQIETDNLSKLRSFVAKNLKKI